MLGSMNVVVWLDAVHTMIHESEELLWSRVTSSGMDQPEFTQKSWDWEEMYGDKGEDLPEGFLEELL